jgi:hypothetical protein
MVYDSIALPISLGPEDERAAAVASVLEGDDEADVLGR